MPFQVIKKNNGYSVQNKDTKKTYGVSKTKAKSEAQMRLLDMIMKKKEMK